MIVIIDYGMGNLRSAQKGIEKAGFGAVVSENPADIARAAGIVLPGVGAFKDCYQGLADGGFVEPLREAVAAEKPLLGICVGMQLLFSESCEGDGSQGLGFITGKVVRFPPAEQTGLKVPHMGWNRVRPAAHATGPLIEALTGEPYMYFVHSYYPEPEDTQDVIATTDYGVEFASVVGRGRVFGTQFHPEKSQHAGIRLLAAFGSYVARIAPEAAVSG